MLLLEHTQRVDLTQLPVDYLQMIIGPELMSTSPGISHTPLAPHRSVPLTPHAADHALGLQLSEIDPNLLQSCTRDHSNAPSILQELVVIMTEHLQCIAINGTRVHGASLRARPATSRNIPQRVS